MEIEQNFKLKLSKGRSADPDLPSRRRLLRHSDEAQREPLFPQRPDVLSRRQGGLPRGAEPRDGHERGAGGNRGSPRSRDHTRESPPSDQLPRGGGDSRRRTADKLARNKVGGKQFRMFFNFCLQE